jgi:hypothetical protein
MDIYTISQIETQLQKVVGLSIKNYEVSCQKRLSSEIGIDFIIIPVI